LFSEFKLDLFQRYLGVGGSNPSRAIGFSPQGVSHRDDFFEAANPSRAISYNLKVTTGERFKNYNFNLL